MSSNKNNTLSVDGQHKQELTARFLDVEEKMTVVGKHFFELQQQYADLQKRLGITPSPATSPRKHKHETTTTKPSAANFDGKTDATVQAARIWNTHISSIIANGGKLPTLTGKKMVNDVKVGSLLQSLRQNIKHERPVAMLRVAYINEHMKNSPAAMYVNIPVTTRQTTAITTPMIPMNKRVPLDDDFTKFMQEQVQNLSIHVQQMEMGIATEKVLQGEANLAILNN